MSKSKAKFSKVSKIIKELPEDKKQIAEDMLKRLKFMANTLDELQEQIESEGAVINAINGNGFEVMTEHPAHRAYTTLVSRYNPLCKSLVEIVSEPSIEKENDSLLSFLRRESK